MGESSLVGRDGESHAVVDVYSISKACPSHTMSMLCRRLKNPYFGKYVGKGAHLVGLGLPLLVKNLNLRKSPLH